MYNWAAVNATNTPKRHFIFFLLELREAEAHRGKKESNTYELCPEKGKMDTLNELPRKYCKTLIIYQISQNISIYSGARFFDPLDIDFRSL